MKDIKKEFVYTLKMFMQDYEGFDWKNGKVIVVNGTVPHICTGSWKYLLEQFKNREIKRWTHDENTMVITI